MGGNKGYFALEWGGGKLSNSRKAFLRDFPSREAEGDLMGGGGVLEDKGEDRDGSWGRSLTSHRGLGFSLSKLQEPHADTPIIHVQDC